MERQVVYEGMANKLVGLTANGGEKAQPTRCFSAASLLT